MISKQTQELINKAKYNALHHKKANELCAKSLGISVNELHERFIQTDLAYRAYNVIAFTNKDEARSFMKNFFQTRVEQLIGDTTWKITEYRPSYNDDYVMTFKRVNTIYGSCYTIEDIKYIKNIY